MADSFSPARNYILMQVGGDIGTWGSNLNNDAISVIDNNLGGTLTLSVAGGTNVTLSSSQVENLYYNFTGVLTGNIEVIWPTGSGFYIINNNTTGSFTLTVQPIGGTGIVIAQGAVSEVFISTNTGTAFLTNNTFAPLASPTFTGTISGVNESLTGNSSVGGTLGVTGNSTLTGTVAVTGEATFNGGVNVSTLTASELISTDGSSNLVSTTALPSGTTANTGSARAGGGDVATQSYVDNASHFGAWNYFAYGVNTIYLAATDGFVAASVENNSGAPPSMQGITDSSSNPTTIVLQAEGQVPPGANASLNMTMPVIKGNYWMITVQNASVIGISFLPLGN